MRNNNLRVILDTNLWISFLISNNFSKLDNILSTGKVTLLFSQELLDEFLSVARRPKFARFFGPDKIDLVLDILPQFSEFIHVHTKLDICRDPKDNFLLSLAVDGEAHFLLTGDADLLTLGNIDQTKISTIADFIETLC